MADTRLGSLSDGSPTGTSLLPFSESGTTYSGTCGEFKNAIINPGTTLGQVFKVTGSGSSGMIDDDFCLSYIISNGTAAIAQTGMYPYFQVNYSGVIESIDIMSGTTPGNATLSIWKGNYDTPPTSTANTIMGAVGTEVITFTGGTKAQGTPVITAFSKGDVFAINLNGAGTIPFLSTMIKGRKTATS